MSCAPTPHVVGEEHFAHAIPFCQMMANPERYIDREVLVSGLYVLTPHRGEIYGAGCEDSAMALRGEVSRPSDKNAMAIIGRAEKQISGARVPIVAEGVLRKYRGPGITMTPDEFWLEGAQIVAADGKHVERLPR